MLLFDTNILVYAANKDSELHLSCRQRLEEAVLGPSPAFLTWGICYEFLRVTTHPRVLQSPWGSRDALRFVSNLLASPGFEVLVATPKRESHVRLPAIPAKHEDARRSTPDRPLRSSKSTQNRAVAS